MIQSSFIETLSLLKPAELDRFQKFVVSPFFNEGSYTKDTIDLLTFLLPFAPSFGHPDLSMEQAYRAIYPDKTYVKGKIEVVMSKLHQLLKQFAAQTAVNVFEVPESLRLATFFLDRDAPLRAAPILEKLKEIQDKQSVHDIDFWVLRFLTQMQISRYDTLRQNNHDHESLSNAIHALHHAYLVQSLDLLNELFYSGRKSKVNDSFAELIAHGIPIALQISDTEKEPLLRLLGLGFDFARNPEQKEPSVFEQYLKDLEMHDKVLPRYLLKTLYRYARNYCTWHNNRGDIAYLPLLLKIFKYSLQNELLYEDGKIQAATFLNMVQTGLGVGEYDWVKNVLDQCKERIAGVPDSLGFYHYNLANYYYHLKEYNKALDLIPMGSDGLFNGLMLRKLELKIYYETDSVLLDSKIDNFKLFIFRQGKKNLVENIFLMNNAFIDMLKSMVTLANTGNDKKIQKLKQKLSETQLIAERKWLEVQLERLK